jgi:hypothetical protein
MSLDLTRKPRPVISVGQRWHTPSGDFLDIVAPAADGSWDVMVNNNLSWMHLSESASWILQIGRLDGFCYLSPVERACEAWFGERISDHEVVECVHAALRSAGWDGTGEPPPMVAFKRGRCELIPPDGWRIDHGGGAKTSNRWNLLIEPGAKPVCMSGGWSPYNEIESAYLPFTPGDQ